MAIRDSLFSLKFLIKCHSTKSEDSCIIFLNVNTRSCTTFLYGVSKVGGNQVFLISKSNVEAFVLTDDSGVFQSPGIFAALALSLYLRAAMHFLPEGYHI